MSAIKSAIYKFSQIIFIPDIYHWIPQQKKHIISDRNPFKWHDFTHQSLCWSALKVGVRETLGSACFVITNSALNGSSFALGNMGLDI